ncbi:uncharacterized protein LOC124176261 isoform X1 [Neodiprion fabricii]|uniref:uncharacterized protein LOC124176261 isoform X1 n=1 Tax=Neodiprion fabricii TaxID=2872261 RepID=UPI001ED8C1A6|nr:uncharacterized protein LOC124176261 isoform X1 [Neodiprion fabricii]
MNGRMSLVEQKRLQWAKEREEMARLSCASWGTTVKPVVNVIHDAVRSRMSTLAGVPELRRGCGSGIDSTKSVGRVAGETHLLRASLISLQDTTDVNDRGPNGPILRQRSPSLPPIYTRESGGSLQHTSKQVEVDQVGLRYQGPDHTQLNHHNSYPFHNHIRRKRYGDSPREELGGETSGYASDSAEVPLPAVADLLPNCKPPGSAMSENNLQNPTNYNCYVTPESSLPPSRRLSAVRGCTELRPRWGSLWGQELIRGDPPPPSWLERGLSRIDHTSQVLVINHESASSPDSSTTSSAGPDSNKTYLRGQNVPLDDGVLQEREVKRQKALELQNAIKHQLEERDRQRKEEKQQRLMEEQAEEERIKRERDKEKQRFEEEQRKFKEKEDTEHKKAEAMRQVLEAAERLAKEEKKYRRKHNNMLNLGKDENNINVDAAEPAMQSEICPNQISEKKFDHSPVTENTQSVNDGYYLKRENKELSHSSEYISGKESSLYNNIQEPKVNTIQLPVSSEIAIVLSGRLQDPEILNASNLQVNLVVTPTPTKSESVPNLFSVSNTPLSNVISPATISHASQHRYAKTTDTRLLTPSKYRTTIAREFGTQTDLEDMHNNACPYKEMSMKERKESLNTNRREIEKSTNTVLTEELSMKTLSRSKAQSRSSLEARPRWNANRPGTRYRTQSEKDPHYQRRLRLRRRQLDSSDDGSRSPSLERRKPTNLKSKNRNTMRRTIKLDSYDADLSMDSLNSIVPLKVDKNGKIHIENNKNNKKNKPQSNEIINDERSLSIKEGNEKLNTWYNREILLQLTTLRNGLAMKQKEWDPQRCLVSPSAEFE